MVDREILSSSCDFKQQIKETVMTLPNSKRLVLKTVHECLLVEKNVRFVYVYGSILNRKDPRDIDLAVYLKPRGDTWGRAQEIAGQMEKKLKYVLPVDIHALNDVSLSFAFGVISKGKLLFERDKDERLTWEAHTLSRYQDIKPMLDFYDKKFLSQ